METRIFTFEDIDENLPQHTLKMVDAVEAKKLIEEGKAVEVNLGKYEEFRKKSRQLYNEYKKVERKYKESDNPLHTEDVKQYEIGKAYKEFEKESKALQAEWEQELERMQAGARAKAVRATVDVTPIDKQMAEQFANRARLDVAQAASADKLKGIVDQIASDIKYLNDAEKTALQAQLPELLNDINDKAYMLKSEVNTSKIIRAAKDIRNIDLLAVKIAEQLPFSVVQEFDRVKIVKSAKTNKEIKATKR